MSPKDSIILNEFAMEIRRFAPDCSVWAYGSRVRGNATAESDLDVCVVASKMSSAFREKIRTIAWRVGFKHDVVISTVKYDRESFENGPPAASPLVRNILTEGVAA